jgi:hypothetical protein
VLSGQAKENSIRTASLQEAMMEFYTNILILEGYKLYLLTKWTTRQKQESEHRSNKILSSSFNSTGTQLVDEFTMLSAHVS